MTLYTKPEEVQAIQWLGDNLPAVMELPQAKACLWWDRNEIGQEMLFLIQRGYMKPVSKFDWIVVRAEFQFEIFSPDEMKERFVFIDSNERNDFSQILKHFVTDFALMLQPGENVREIYTHYENVNKLSIDKLIIIAKNVNEKA
jgi:hypothetical protein